MVLVQMTPLDSNDQLDSGHLSPGQLVLQCLLGGYSSNQLNIGQWVCLGQLSDSTGHLGSPGEQRNLETKQEHDKV